MKPLTDNKLIEPVYNGTYSTNYISQCIYQHRNNNKEYFNATPI